MEKGWCGWDRVLVILPVVEATNSGALLLFVDVFVFTGVGSWEVVDVDALLLLDPDRN